MIEQQQKDMYISREYITKSMSQRGMLKVRLWPG